MLVSRLISTDDCMLLSAASITLMGGLTVEAMVESIAVVFRQVRKQSGRNLRAVGNGSRNFISRAMIADFTVCDVAAFSPAYLIK